MHKSPQCPDSGLLQGKGHLEKLQRVWICPEDQALFNHVQNRGSRLYLPSYHET